MRSRKRCGYVLGVALAVGLSACGGGGGGGAAPAGPPPPNPLYVTINGRDTNIGDLQHPLKSVTEAAQIALNGYTIIVAPGTYRQLVTTERHGAIEAQGLSIIADVAGDRTGIAPGPVVINAAGLGGAQVVALANTPGSAIDGFTIIGGDSRGIVVSSDSNNVQVRNCIVHDNGDDGILVQDSANVVVFNNLVYNNVGSGVSIGGNSIGSPSAVVINNTIFGNRFRGIDVGTSNKASPDAFLRNNIVQNSGQDFSIKVFTSPRSDLGYDADFNLVLPATYLPADIHGIHDIAKDAAFVDTGGADFHLRSTSPAINVGDSLNGMPTLANALRGLTTTGGTNCDKSAIDLGYHFAPSDRCTAVP